MRGFDPSHRQRIIGRIEQYAADPGSLANQVIALANSRYRRLRVGDHRVIFDIDHSGTPTMVIIRVRHRREAYD